MKQYIRNTGKNSIMINEENRNNKTQNNYIKFVDRKLNSNFKN